MPPINPGQAMREVGFSFTQAAFAGGRNLEKSNGLIRKLDLIVDGEIAKIHSVSPPVACKKGCDHCCHRVACASLPEVLAVADFVARNFTPKQRAGLDERLSAYELEVAPHFGVDLQEARPTCPLLVDGLCAAYEARPFDCRAANSFAVSACKAVQADPKKGWEAVPLLMPQRMVIGGVFTGFHEVLSRLNLDGRLYDFGRALKIALDDPSACEKYFESTRAFEAARIVGMRSADAPPAPVDPPLPRYGPGQEPSGKVNGDGLTLAHYHQIRSGDMEASLAALTGRHPLYRLNRIIVPRIYRSIEEIEVWRKRYVQEIENFRESNFDPREAFDGLGWFATFCLAYQLNDVREPLAMIGDLICNDITAKALPDLAEPIAPKWSGGKLKVGYISERLRGSNASAWALGWLDNHAADFETYAIHLGQSEDSWTRRWKAEADHWCHLTGNVPDDARTIKSLGLDALIYTDIGMAPRNSQFASMRLAPVQCTAWGHPVTSGMPTVGHYLSSALMEPENGDEHYTENLVRLANSGLCYQRHPQEPSNLTKAHYGLDDGPLYFAGQNLMKYGPQWDFLYRRINEITGRPIVLVEGQEPVDMRMTQERMERAGVKTKWISRLGQSDYLRLLSLAEVSLDPPGWSGGNTTIQALMCGVPVVTLPGEFMRGRHSLAFLRVAGAPGLIAKDPDDYVDLAVNGDRRRDAMKELNAGAIFDDKACVADLDAFLRAACAK